MKKQSLLFFIFLLSVMSITIVYAAPPYFKLYVKNNYTECDYNNICRINTSKVVYGWDFSTVYHLSEQLLKTYVINEQPDPDFNIIFGNPSQFKEQPYVNIILRAGDMKNVIKIASTSMKAEDLDLSNISNPISIYFVVDDHGEHVTYSEIDILKEIDWSSSRSVYMNLKSAIKDKLFYRFSTIAKNMKDEDINKLNANKHGILDKVFTSEWFMRSPARIELIINLVERGLIDLQEVSKISHYYRLQDKKTEIRKSFNPRNKKELLEFLNRALENGGVSLHPIWCSLDIPDFLLPKLSK